MAESDRDSRRMRPLIKGIKMTPLLAKSACDIANIMLKLEDEDTNVQYLLFVIVSYAWSTGQGEVFIDIVERMDIVRDMRELYTSMLGEL